MDTKAQQIVYIHGGTAFSRYRAFLDHLRTKLIEDPLGLVRVKKWKDTLQGELGDTYEIYFPAMPNSSNAKYQEWKIWFERYHEFLRDGVILIGHSLGGYFLTKYLTEERMAISVRALYLLAAPFENDDFGGEDGGDFEFDPRQLSRLAEQVESVFVLHSLDDPIVPYRHALKYVEALPDAKLVTFEDKNHFILEEFPEFVYLLKDSTRAQV